ncbi:hypothetical protein ASG94_09725 [Nocardioides sp. Soil805]|nr:hypothetical protein ASG94_09725 [Nocardioides sp. Soil805]
MFVLCGVLFAVSAEQSDGTDLRGGRYTDLASVVQAERNDTNALTREVSGLNDEIETLTDGLGDRTVNRYQDEIDTLVDPAGLTPRTGQAVKVTLTDAPEDVLSTTDRDQNDLVVHQQDLQAVVNALWRAGAVAVTLQGQRIISTTGIKCEGNSVTLHGVPYSPPYEIVGIGDPDEMLTSLDEDSYLDVYREYAADPTGGVGYAVTTLPRMTAPAYDGLLDLTYATPMATTGQDGG